MSERSDLRGLIRRAQLTLNALPGPLSVANGGTGLTSGTSGGILGFTAATTLASSVALTANALVLGGGVGATPTPMASLGTTTTVLHGNAAGAPTFGAVSLSADITGTLGVGNGGTNLTSGTSGGVLGFTAAGVLASSTALTANAVVIGGGAGATPTTIAAGSNNQFLRGNTGLAPAFGAATLASADFANQGTTTTVLHGNAAGNPSWGAVSLTADITGTLGVGNGGTGLPSGTSGGVLGFTAAGTIASSAALAANQIVLGGGAGATPTTLGSLGTTTTVLHGNAAGAPTFGAVANADLTNSSVTYNGTAVALGSSGTLTLASANFANQGTTTTVLHGNAAGNPSWGAVSLTADVTGDLPYANLAQGSALSVLGVTGNATADVASIAAASDHQVLRRSGTALTFGAVDLSQAAAVTNQLGLGSGGTAANLTASNGGIVYSTASALAILAGTATAGQVLRSGASAAPSWSTATYPATATGTGTILRADGTNWSATTATYPSTITATRLLYGSATNVISETGSGLQWDGSTLLTVNTLTVSTGSLTVSGGTVTSGSTGSLTLRTLNNAGITVQDGGRWGNATIAIDSSEQLTVNQATASAVGAGIKNVTAATCTIGVWNADTSGDNVFENFYTEAGGTLRGSIDYNRTGGLVRYNTSSDARMKRDLGIYRDTRVLKDTLIHEFEWRQSKGRGINVFAQEAYAVYPDAVSKGDQHRVWRKPWQVSLPAYVPHLIAGWQDHEARIAALEQAQPRQETLQ